MIIGFGRFLLLWIFGAAYQILVGNSLRTLPEICVLFTVVYISRSSMPELDDLGQRTVVSDALRKLSFAHLLDRALPYQRLVLKHVLEKLVLRFSVLEPWQDFIVGLVAGGVICIFKSPLHRLQFFHETVLVVFLF